MFYPCLEIRYPPKLLKSYYKKYLHNLLTINDLHCIFTTIKVKSVTQLKPLAGRVPVKRNGLLVSSSV